MGESFEDLERRGFVKMLQRLFLLGSEAFRLAALRDLERTACPTHGHCIR